MRSGMVRICAIALIAFGIGITRGACTWGKEQLPMTEESVDYADQGRVFVVEKTAQHPGGEERDVESSLMKKVSLEGIAWAGPNKSLGSCVLMDRALIYVRGIDFADGRKIGRLVRVQGRLVRRVVPAVRADAQGPKRDLVYYAVEVEKAEWIDRVARPRIVVVD